MFWSTFIPYMYITQHRNMYKILNMNSTQPDWLQQKLNQYSTQPWMACIFNCTYTPTVLQGLRPLQWLKETVYVGETKKIYKVLVQKHGQKTLLRTLRHKQKACHTFSKAIFLAPLPKRCQTVTWTTELDNAAENQSQNKFPGLHSSDCSLLWQCAVLWLDTDIREKHAAFLY